MRYIIFILLAFLIFSCKEKPKENTTKVTEQDTAGLIQITDEQAKAWNITTTKISRKAFKNTIQCRGVIAPKTHGKALVSPPMEGNIKNLYVQQGDYVKKGQLLAKLENNRYIDLQKDMLEARSYLDYYEENFKRKGELTIENAASIKDMQLSQRDYLAWESKYKALKTRLKIIGIDPGKIQADNFVSQIELRAPINGYITAIKGNTGKLIPGKKALFEIIDKTQLRIILHIHEKKINQISKGQKLTFTMPGERDNQHEAIITMINPKVEKEKQNIKVFASPAENIESLLPGMSIKASVQTGRDTAYFLPKEAVIKTNDTTLVFIQTNTKQHFYKPLPVDTEPLTNQYIKIKQVSDTLLHYPIVIKGNQELYRKNFL